MIVDQKHTLGRTFVKLIGDVEFVPVTGEPVGGYYSVTIEQDGLYYLGLMRIGDSVFDKWWLPSFKVWASKEATSLCSVKLDVNGVLAMSNNCPTLKKSRLFMFSEMKLSKTT